MDHIDGTHHNNTPENLITICKACHARNCNESGHFNSEKAASRTHIHKDKTGETNMLDAGAER